MDLLRTVRNYLFYCGIEKDEYNAVKKDAYISNYKIWRILHCLMTAVFAFLFVFSLFDGEFVHNKPFYLAAFIYSAAVTVAFFLLRKDSIIAQFVIYLSIAVLFLFAAFISGNTSYTTATTFVVLLLITPMFMIDKPYFMGIVLCIASAVFIFWMRGVKPPIIWRADVRNVILFAVIGFLLHIVSNSIRIKEFTLTRKINVQKDTDDLTGLKNKGALTREINEFLADPEKDKGAFFILDIDRFKAINDTYGHDYGDSVIRRLGAFLKEYFTHGETVGRFGGDEFIIFIKDNDDAADAVNAARDILSGAAAYVTLPDDAQKLSLSVGVALYHGPEKNYSEIFKKADAALYDAKGSAAERIRVYGE